MEKLEKFQLLLACSVISLGILFSSMITFSYNKVVSEGKDSQHGFRRCITKHFWRTVSKTFSSVFRIFGSYPSTSIFFIKPLLAKVFY